MSEEEDDMPHTFGGLVLGVGLFGVSALVMIGFLTALWMIGTGGW